MEEEVIVYGEDVNDPSIELLDPPDIVVEELPQKEIILTQELVGYFFIFSEISEREIIDQNLKLFLIQPNILGSSS